MRVPVIGLGCLLSMLLAAPAALAGYSVDWHTPRDGLLTRSGSLEWLDINQTQRSGYSLSQNEIAALLTTDFAGFRYATKDELIGLLNAAGTDPYLDPSDPSQTYAAYWTNSVLLNLTGASGVAFPPLSFWAFGLMADGCEHGFGVVGGDGYVNLNGCEQPANADSRIFQYGTWLVRVVPPPPVPEPSTAALVTLGLIIMARLNAMADENQPNRAS